MPCSSSSSSSTCSRPPAPACHTMLGTRSDCQHTQAAASTQVRQGERQADCHCPLLLLLLPASNTQPATHTLTQLPLKPPSCRSAATTLWQGTSGANGLRRIDCSTAAAARQQGRAVRQQQEGRPQQWEQRSCMCADAVHASCCACV